MVGLTDAQRVGAMGPRCITRPRAAGVIYQATLRRELHQSMGFEWAPVDPTTGMAELAGARVLFEGEYLRERVTHGYALTVHSAQGVTADTTHRCRRCWFRGYASWPRRASRGWCSRQHGVASRRGKLRPGYDHGTRAPQQPQSGPQSRLRDRDVSTLGWRRRILSRTNLCEEFPYWRRGARRAQGSYPVLVGLDLCRLANRPPGRREACRSRHRRDAAQVHDLTQPLQRLNCQGRGCARQLP
jgi:hypothetical protein